MGQQSSVQAASSKPRPAALIQAAAEVPARLQWWQPLEAQRLLSGALQHLEAQGLEAPDLPLLRSALLPALAALPSLEAWPEPQLLLAFAATGLAASILGKADADPQLRRAARPLLQQAARLTVAAWQPGGNLAAQSADNCRFALRVAGTLLERERRMRPELTGLIQRCVGHAAAQFWTSKFFTSHLQVVLEALAHGPLEELLAVGAQASISPLSSTDSLVKELMQQCHASRSLEILERVFMLLENWGRLPLRSRSSVERWLRFASELPLVGEGQALTPVACIVAFLLGRLGAAASAPESDARRALTAWLAGGLLAPVERHEDLILQGYVAAAALGTLSQQREPDWWAVPAGALRRLLCEVLLPSWLLDRNDPELEAHKGSPVCRLVPVVASSLSDCLPHLSEQWQASLVMQPLEALAVQWSGAWDAQSGEAQYAAVRQWFCSVVFFLVSTLARPVASSPAGIEAQLHCLRALAQADVFRQGGDDTYEHRAICAGIVERGAESPIFVGAMLWTLAEYFGLSSAGAQEEVPLSRLTRLHFLLGVLACPAVIGSEDFFDTAWPVVTGCVRGGGAGGAQAEQRVVLARRAHDLAGICLEQAGTTGRTQVVQEYVLASIAAFATSPHDDVCSSLLSTVVAVSKDVAIRCDRDGGIGEARKLQRWLLQTLGSAALEELRADRTEAGEGLFKVLCGVAEHVDMAFLPEPFYEESGLRAILKAHPPARELWLRHLVVRFPEREREALVLAMLDDFPESFAAAEEASGSGLAAAVAAATSALGSLPKLGGMLRSAL